MSGSFTCDLGGNVSYSGLLSASGEYEDDSTLPFYWKDTYAVTDFNLTFNSCVFPVDTNDDLVDENYTLGGQVLYDLSDSFTIDQRDSSLNLIDFSFTFDETEDGSISISEASLGSFSFTFLFDILGSVVGYFDINTGTDTITSVNVTATVAVDGQTCTGTWTDINENDFDWSCK